MRLLVWFVAGSLAGFLVLVAGAALLDVRLDGSGGEVESLKPLPVPPVEQPRVKSRCNTLVEVDPPWAAHSVKVASAGSFTVPEGLERRVAFWKGIWRDLDNHVFVLVDPRLPWVVHGRVDCRDLYDSETPEGQADQSCRLRIMETLQETKDAIRRRWKEEQGELLGSYGNRPWLARTAHRSLMLVEGHKQSLSRALRRSRGKLDVLEKIFEGAGLPPELARLAIVESLFKTDAVSRSGAVGAYQFVASTGREYLMIRRGIDERKDPLRSAWAAARYLKRLHKRFGRLDLALTAYNVGPTRLARMIRRNKTRSLNRLIRSAKDEGFGFDGQNYFAQIAAVLDLCADQEVQPRAQDQTAAFQLTRPMRLNRVAVCLDLSPEQISARNPAFSRAIRNKGAKIPRGYLVRAPQNSRYGKLPVSALPSRAVEAPLVAGVQKKKAQAVD